MKLWYPSIKKWHNLLPSLIRLPTWAPHRNETNTASVDRVRAYRDIGNAIPLPRFVCKTPLNKILILFGQYLFMLLMLIVTHIAVSGVICSPSDKPRNISTKTLAIGRDIKPRDASIQPINAHIRIKCLSKLFSADANVSISLLYRTPLCSWVLWGSSSLVDCWYMAVAGWGMSSAYIMLAWLIDARGEFLWGGAR